jgi:DNA-binding transcriptional LysR family regulator
MEARSGVSLVNRTTRRMSLTPEGELYLEHARRILGEIDDMEQLLGVPQGRAQGLLRVNATLGFGRSHVAPLISRFVRKYPQVEVQLQLSVNPPPLTDDSPSTSASASASRRTPGSSPAHRAQPAAAVRGAGLPGRTAHPRCRNDLTQAQLHRHPPGRRGLRRMAADQRPRQARRPNRSRPAAT